MEARCVWHGWTSECLRELFEQFSTDRTGFNPEVAAIVPMQAPVRHRTGRQRRVCGHQRRLPLRAGVIRGSPCATAFAERHLIKDVADEREIIRAELPSTCLENWMAPKSAVTRCGDAIYVSGFPPFDPASGTVIEAPIERQTGSAAA